MTHTISLKKMLNAAIIAAVAIAPFMGAVSIAQAAPNHSNPAWQVDSRRGNQHWRGRNRRDRRGDNDRRRRNPSWNDRKDFRTFVGVVSKAKSGDEFNIKIDGKTYNVYLDSRRPRGLDKDDLVRVYGKRVGANDIRNANVTVLRNR